MELMALGGWMMWPLMIASIWALAIIIERFLVLQTYSVPSSALMKTLPMTDTKVIAEKLGVCSKLEPFVKTLQADQFNEVEVTSAGQAVVNDMEKHLDMLSNLARIATLMGLLGTILGMIDTFSVIAQNPSGIDMTMLAQGIWQALITTATGLIIAIPSYLALAYYRGRVNAMGDALTLIANRFLVEKTQSNQ